MAKCNTLQPCSICDYPYWDNDETPESVNINGTNRIRDQFVDIEGERLDQLQQYAIRGCSGCRCIQAAREFEVAHMQANLQPSPKELPTIGRVRLWKKSNFNGYLFLIFESSRPVGEFGIVDLFTRPDDPPFPGLRTAYQIPSDTELQTSLPQIMSWLSACLKDHKPCNRRNEYLPPRLLDLNIEDDRVLRLVDNDVIERDEQAKYVCLSHCWGKTRNELLTTTKTLISNKTRIDLDKLPLTFQDAIRIARALSVRYIWIDSMCIIQDDPRDWQSHVVEMSAIYRNSFCTLAAGASENGEGGFFRQARDQYTAFNHCLITEMNIDYQIFIRHKPEHPFEGMNPTWPLNKRGWVFQEYMLSPRFIAFGPDEIHWSCREAASCSCSVGAGLFKSDPKMQERDPLHEYKSWMFMPQLTGSSEPADRWRTMIEIYSLLDLTFASDRLPAIAGLAALFKCCMEPQKELGVMLVVSRHHALSLSKTRDDLFGANEHYHRYTKIMQQVWPDEYLAGMWRSSIHRDIAWIPNWTTEKSSSEKSKVGSDAPSWSFLTAVMSGGSIFWRSGRRSLPYTVNEVSVTRDANNELGYLKSGVLTIFGTILQVLLAPRKDEKLDYGGLSQSVSVRLPEYASSKLESTDSKADAISAHCFPDYRFWNTDENLFKQIQVAYVFVTGFDDRPECSHQAQGILLRPTSEDREKPTFKRIGWLEMQNNHAIHQWICEDLALSVFCLE